MDGGDSQHKGPIDGQTASVECLAKPAGCTTSFNSTGLALFLLVVTLIEQWIQKTATRKVRFECGFIIARQPREARDALACCEFALHWISLSSLCSLLFIVLAGLQRRKSLFGCLCLPDLHFYVPTYKNLIRRLPRKTSRKIASAKFSARMRGVD